MARVPVSLFTETNCFRIRKSRHYFADSGGRSVGIVRLRTKATEFFNCFRIACAHLTPSLQRNSLQCVKNSCTF
jgi:hypothetical protein